MVDLGPYKVILASKSPRRHELLAGLEIPFTVRSMDVDESFPDTLKGADIALYLSEKKAAAHAGSLSANELLITSDTIVWRGDHVFNKPQDEAEAVEMILALSGKMHEVITAVCISTREKSRSFSEVTKVYFAEVERADAVHYVAKYKPLDKAGAYGIQEWIGYAAIDRIEGSFYNVMGFPTRMFYQELKAFLK